MKGASITDYTIQSSQKAVHEDLQLLVQKHVAHEYRYPISAKQKVIFEEVVDILREQDKPIILDSGCGTGMSTVNLSEQFPDHFIVGIDKSEARLSRNRLFRARQSSREWTLHDNILLVRADCIAFWLQLAKTSISIARHYLLYPNPWPKPGHVQRRWQGHPVFPTLLRLSSYVEMRTNWLIYAQEWQAVIELLTNNHCELSEVTFQQPLSAFEKKYRDARQLLYRVCMTA